MLPIYFPFTYISEPAMAGLASCFRQTVVYQPSPRNLSETMEKLAKIGIIDIRIPVKGDEDRLDAIIKDYRKWAELHQGGGLAFLKSQGNNIPFFEETSSQIRSDIIRGSKSEVRDLKTDEPDPLFNARIFLSIAHEFDMQSYELNTELRSFEKMEMDLLKGLKGEEEYPNFGFQIPGSGFPREDPGVHMTRERTEAWASVLQHDPEISGIFVTSSRAVFDDLMEKIPDAQEVLHIDSIPIYDQSNMDEKIALWQDTLMKHLNILAESTWPVPTEDVEDPPFHTQDRAKVSLTFCLVPGKTAIESFNCYAGKEIFRKENQCGYKNTLFGIMDFK